MSFETPGIIKQACISVMFTVDIHRETAGRFAAAKRTLLALLHYNTHASTERSGCRRLAVATMTSRCLIDDNQQERDSEDSDGDGRENDEHGVLE